jgi:hypothetical protein
VKHGRRNGQKLNINTGFFWEREPAEGSPARELDHIAIYRPGVNITGAGGKVSGRSLGRKMFFGSLKNAVTGQSRK